MTTPMTATERSRVEVPWRAGTRIAVVIPHPDDELWMGGTIALATTAGAVVELIALTAGEAGTDYRQEKLTGATLAAHRVSELRASAAILGVADVEVWHLPDGGLFAMASEPIVARLATRLAAFDVILTLGRNGIYGHLDHTRTTQWLEAALKRLAPRPEAFGLVFAPGFFEPVWASFRRRRPTLAEPAFGPATPRSSAALAVDIHAVEDTKRRAIRAHTSQLRGPDEDAFFVPGTLPHMLGEELFERL